MMIEVKALTKFYGSEKISEMYTNEMQKSAYEIDW